VRAPGAVLASLAAFAALACQPKGEERDDPVAAARGFLSAVHRWDCETAWTYFSDATQAYVEHKSREMQRSLPYAERAFAPHRLYCNPTSVGRFHSYVPASVRLQSVEGPRATVLIEVREGTHFLLPGFWPTRTKVSLAEMHLVEEAGGWKVALP
jgi:hypothetical protein